MKKEGTGKPQDPDISLDADVKMRELRFEKVPDPEVRFRGNTGRNSVWASKRTNLPDEVQEGVVYRDAGIRLRIATEVVEGPFDAMNNFDHGGVKTTRSERKRTSKTRNAKELR